MTERGALRDVRRRRNAERILTRVLGGLESGLRVRLWEGSELTFGASESPFTLVIRDRETFRRVFRGTRTRALAEAFVENRVEVEGDLFAALRLAGVLEGRRLRLRDRLVVLHALLGV